LGDLGQLQFVTDKVEGLVDELLAEAETPPVIILQADHGTKSIREEEPNERVLRERLGILNAYYLPDDGEELLYETITPVNSFRLVFNAYFDTDYDFLEDRVYFCKLNRPYDIIEVTDVLQGN
jgi:hypothetical protein